MRRFGRFSNYLAKAEDGLALAGAFVICVMMVYTVVAVATRYAGNPIKGGTEYITLLFVMAIMFAVSFAQRRWEHLAMGVLFDRLSPRARRPVILVLLSFGIFICFLLTWSTLKSTIWAYSTGDELLGAIPVKTWWSRMGLPIGLSIPTVRLVFQLVQVVRREMAL